MNSTTIKSIVPEKYTYIFIILFINLSEITYTMTSNGHLSTELMQIICRTSGEMADSKTLLHLERIVSLQIDRLLKLAQVNARMRGVDVIIHHDVIQLIMDEQMQKKVVKLVMLILETT